MKMRRLVEITAVVTIAVVACGSGKNVDQASCNSTGAVLTDADCQRLGTASGCETSSLSGNGCSFKNCDAAPSCTAAPSSTDAGTTDAALSPRCSETTNGLWSTTPPCSDVSTVTINGAMSYACKCGGTTACPCNFKCGSIPLASGGVLSSVCAP